MTSTARRRPRFALAEAAALARAYWGVEGAPSALPSERDQNVLLTTAAGPAWVLKVARADERPEEIALQHAALAWVAARDPGLPLPRIRATPDGRNVVEVEGRNGERHLARLLAWLPGTPLAEARPRDEAVLRALGGLLGRLDRALSGFTHLAARGRDLDWDPARAAAVVARDAPALRDPERRALVEHFVGVHRAALPDGLDALRAAVIHNDANDHNVLVGPPEEEGRAVVGLLDLGDMVEAPVVCEAAVAVAYAVLGQRDALAAACGVVAGYHAAFPLEEREIALVLPLAAMRLCTSVCLSARRGDEESDNPYLTVTEAPAWKGLARLRAVPPRLAEAALRQACGLPALAGGAALQRWLSACAPGPVLDADVTRAVVLDLSVGSPEFASPDEAADLGALARVVERGRQDGRAAVAIGRYDEARLVYASDAFRSASGERRTVHLGIDLFAPAGTAVRAPLPGRVHSLDDNAAPYDYGPTVILEHRPADGPAFYTLYGHLGPDALGAFAPGAVIEQGTRIGTVGAPPGNGGWPPHLHFQVIGDLLGFAGDFPGVAPPGQRALWLALCPDPNLLLRLPLPSPPRSGQVLRTARAERLGRNLSLAYARPLAIVRGSGAFLYADDGRVYLDGVNNVAHVGHSHPRVVRAAQRQMAVLNTNTRYLHEAVVRYAERLAATLPEPLRVLFFVNSGSEANELALRLARTHTGRRDVIVVEAAYHGNTTTLMEVSPYKFRGPGGSGVPSYVHVVPLPDGYRGRYRREDARCGERYAAHVAHAARAATAAGTPPAAFLCESLLSGGGQIVLPPGYLRGAYGAARAAGAVCIADEVQVGFGRVGTHFWAFKTQEVVPDIVSMGKPIGNGHPLGAVATTPEIAASFANGMEFFSTFGGNPVSAEVGLAVLDVIAEERLQERARRVGAHLRGGLDRLRRHEVVGDVRGLGLFLGIELVRDREARAPAPAQARYVVERMKERRVLLSTEGPDHNVIKMKPPLCFSERDADRLVAELDDVLQDDFARVR